jgi:hypothetical protein
MPVYATANQLPDGGYWPCLLVRIDAIRVKHHFSDIVKDKQAADKWLAKEAFMYWRKQVHNFLVQREKALKEVGAFAQHHMAAIYKINQAQKSPSHDGYFKNILQLQTEFICLLPHSGSPFRSWRHYIYELMEYANRTLPTQVERDIYQNHITI